MTLVVGALLLLWLLTQQISSAVSGREKPVDISGESRSPASVETGSPRSNSQGLPQEAIETIRKIQSGERLPYRRDGVVFENRERLLPSMSRGYYHEYTVPTPGAQTRGARRIVTGGDPPQVWYYSADHYRSFTKIEP